MGVRENFLGKMRKDGCIYIPKATLFAASGKNESAARILIEIMLAPT